MKKSLLGLGALGSVLTLVSADRVCQNFEIPLWVTAENYVYALPHFENNYDVADFVTNYGSSSAAVDFHPFSGKQNVTGSYTISANFCTPSDGNAAHKDTVLLATHGLNFDKRYWDAEIQPEKYNFVDYAISRGYSIFYYDRLGVGGSSHLSGYVNQLPMQIDVVAKLSDLVRSGKYTGSIGKPKSLVLVGHSFGSSISAGAAAANPDICDGLILTGFNYNGSNMVGFFEAAQLRIASTLSPEWDDMDTGYLLPVDIYSNVNTFFKKPDYDLEVVKYADDTKYPLGIVELLTAASGNLAPVNFKGKAMIITGQHDFIFCTGECDDVIEHPSSEIFAKAKEFKAISYPGAGHGLNYALNATGAFKEIFDFLDA